MLGDIGKLMALAGKIKTELPAMREKLAASEFSAQAGGGAVSATVNGKLQLIDLRIDAEALADGDVEMLQVVVKAAVASAQSQAAEAAAAALMELTGGMDIPGLEGVL